MGGTFIAEEVKEMWCSINTGLTLGHFAVEHPQGIPPQPQAAIGAGLG
jgi:hypothetical protein